MDIESTFPNTNSYLGSPRGAEWSRWDLHVHTPASIESSFGDGQQENTWDAYIQALADLPPEIKAIGINDYFSIDGYRRVIQAKKDGRLPNLTLILPVIELRLSNFVGSGELRKLNFHVVFSNDISADHIEQFFLRQLNVELQLDGAEPWRGCVGTKEGLLELGRAIKTATPESVRNGSSELEAGFASAALDLQLVFEALRNSVFRDRFLTALGVSEWDQMRWVGAGAAQKRDVINRVNFSYTAASTVAQYASRREQLTKADVNDRLIDASDAHYFADSREPNRLGNTYTWIKADLTFQGLRRAIRRFDDRVFIGNTPAKLERVRTGKTKYIDRISIKKKIGSSLAEVWFDADLPLNRDLVAIIGNQGSGKSALTDVIALCANTATTGFSFLTPEKFRSEKGKRATEFVAQLRWDDGSTSDEVSLDHNSPATSVERVRYVPQGFFDSVTNETAVSEGGKFYSEIRKAIFSHVPAGDRLGCASFDELIKRQTAALDETLIAHRNELAELNQRIVALELDCAQQAVDHLTSRIDQRNKEIEALESSPPQAVSVPAEQDSAAVELETIRASQELLRSEIGRVASSRGQLKQRRIAVDDASKSTIAEERRVRLAIGRIQESLESVGEKINIDDAIAFKFDYSVFVDRLTVIDNEIEATEAALDQSKPDSPAGKLAALDNRRVQVERESQAMTSAYQFYLDAVSAWKTKLAAMKGDNDDAAPESLNGLKRALTELTVKKPEFLRTLESQRREKANEIFRELCKIGDIYERIAVDVREHILRENLTSDRYQLAFDVRVADIGLSDRFFAYVGHQTGTFYGQQQGRDRLRSLLADSRLEDAESAVQFADLLLDHLKRDYKTASLDEVDIVRCLRKGASVEQIYDLIYGFEYLSPVFELGLNGKPLRLLSPGERGILLLVFYLLVDRGDEPLIIDQPEGNLNNQSIVKHLVPVFMAAKQRRQIIIVTHNPNIAVVCDAEQIITCEMEQDASHKVTYRSGALENPIFNKLSLDLLEGTAAALDSRVVTYDAMEGKRDGVRLRVFDWDPSTGSGKPYNQG